MEWLKDPELAKNSVIPILIIILTLTVYICVVKLSYSVLRTWAAENNFEILNVKRCFWCGRSETVFFVTVRDENHHERSAWVTVTRCLPRDERQIKIVWKK